MKALFIIVGVFALNPIPDFGTTGMTLFVINFIDCIARGLFIGILAYNLFDKKKD